ncbi:hypothetical protein NUSPORA_00074 [Nucleospora cyclopteri]
MSCFNMGWSRFTDEIVRNISKNHKNIVFVLMGNVAKAKSSLIDSGNHLIIETVHPSHYNAIEFINSQIFAKITKYLEKYRKPPIKWY